MSKTLEGKEDRDKSLVVFDKPLDLGGTNWEDFFIL
jgi:hypothetical protein